MVIRTECLAASLRGFGIQTPRSVKRDARLTGNEL